MSGVVPGFNDGGVVPGFNDDSFSARVVITALIVLFVVLLLTLELE
jgi:hypothetical protein